MVAKKFLSIETPPRAWGRPRQMPGPLPCHGNTPTCVGKTTRRPSTEDRLPKHPHVRGEDSLPQSCAAFTLETPPRAWGRQRQSRKEKREHGNTPTCVGKTIRADSFLGRFWKHPHVRGEDLYVMPIRHKSTETPPRAWGRRAIFSAIPFGERNTPTCVGKTAEEWEEECLQRKHPHVRGEDRTSNSCTEKHMETPPRAWGRHGIRQVAAANIGNTPTCVGKTYLKKVLTTLIEKHPHVRGEDTWTVMLVLTTGETPPRAWGRPFIRVKSFFLIRNTPTCVGKTPSQA